MASRRVLGFALGEHHDAQLAYGALAMAVAARGGQVPGVIMHTDRGSEYTAALVQQACQRLSIRQSMGRPGSALDNAVIESWHSTLEFELRSLEHFDTRAQARARVSTWIQDYNRDRRHSALGMMSPVAMSRHYRTRRRPDAPASPLPSMPRCSPMSRSFLPGHDLRSGGIWQLSRSTDRQDQPNQSVHAFRGTPRETVCARATARPWPSWSWSVVCAAQLWRWGVSGSRRGARRRRPTDAGQGA